MEAVFACMSTDVLAILPTGYGKTLIIECLPFLTRSASCVVVVNPLIIIEQKQRLGKHCIVIDESLLKDLSNDQTIYDRRKTEIKRLKNGELFLIIGHPEVMQTEIVKKLFLQEPLSSRISHLVIDEAHCIISWGKSEFRPAFIKLGLLRAVLTDAKVLALTATASRSAEKEILESLLMHKAHVIRQSPDRPNMYLEVKERPPSTGDVQASYNQVLDPYFLNLQKDKTDFPHTIMYMPLKWCGYAHQRYLTKFEDLHINQSQEYTGNFSSILAQFHAPQTSEMKSKITEAMQDSESQLRLLFCTEAYSMGADPSKVKNVIHIGPPKNIETYIQEIGRRGRDGERCSATLYFNKSDIAHNVNHLQEEMKRYCCLTSCRREFLMKYFGFEINPARSFHNCCDNCRKTCDCNCDICSVSQKKEIALGGCNAKLQACCLSSLKKYFAFENSLFTESLIPEAFTGLSQQFAVTLANNCNRYSNLQILQEDFSLLKENYANNIAGILRTETSRFESLKSTN